MLFMGGEPSYNRYSNMGNPVFSRNRREFDIWNDNPKRAKIDYDDDDYSLGFIYRSALKLNRRKDETNLTLGYYGVSNGNCATGSSIDSAARNNWISQDNNSYGVSSQILSDDSGGMVYNNNNWTSIGPIVEESEDCSIGQEESCGVATEAIDGSARIIVEEFEDCSIGQEESCGAAPEAIDGLTRMIVEESEDYSISQEESCGVAIEAIDGLDRIIVEESEDYSIGQEENCGVATEAIDDSTKMLNEDCCTDLEESRGVTPEAECGRTDGSVGCEVEDYKCEPELDGLKGLCVSLTDSFTDDQIREHLRSLKESNEIIISGDNTCPLCGKEGLMFAPPPMDCSGCLARIKPGLICYRTEEMGAQYSFCNTCFGKTRGGRISVKDQEQSFPKEVLIKGNNVAENGEAWVLCDKCQRWQHQICALYNPNHDVEGNMTFICPLCRLTERQEIKNVSVTPVRGARDLPRTNLSDHLEQRLFTRLARERKQRAESLGKAVEEVPGAEDLVIRTVLAVDRQIKVKQEFLDILHGENYPSEFPYKSKAIMLFQKVEGAEVCLFAMYVQEFGSECGEPNQRSVYISYIDSVNYFTPDIRTVTGQALRTFVYHEILIGYLDYCKQHGFNTCYIWACPPVRGDDYILHCHPETQKTPKPQKLRKWYKTMLKKAVEDSIVAEYTNFYDYFFVPKDDQNSKITAARLPYFDGGFWTGAIENMLKTMTIGKNCKGESKPKKPKKSMTKRTLKSMGHDGLSDDAAEDIQVMTTLGHIILPSKDDFFVVHLQFTCTNCHEQILSGNRWSCKQCKNLHLCDRCIEGEKSRNGLRTHTTNRGAKHTLIQIAEKDVAANTDDKDIIIDNDIFENRHAFLNFCQRNNYQFDTLRRAKHSTMMIFQKVENMN